MNQFLWGTLAVSGWVAGLFFLRFWLASRERLFMYFFLAFWLLAFNWLGLALVPRVSESRHQVYVLRLIAFVLIIAGIVEKNRGTRLASENGPRRRGPSQR